MKLIKAEYTFDNNKVLFYFTADGRIDFRELVKDLAAVFKQHISRPHTPEILVGLSDRFCSLAILIDTGLNSGKNVAQHKGLPH